MIQNWCLSEQLMEINTNMASLELDEESESITGTDNSVQSRKSLRRSSRIKTKVPSMGFENLGSKNKKSGKTKTMEQYYLSKEVKRLPSTLETIYEEPKSLNNEVQYMSVKRFKRILHFDEENSVIQKIRRSKKRVMKAKKITAANRINTRKKVSMEVLLRKLETIEEEAEKSQ